MRRRVLVDSRSAAPVHIVCRGSVNHIGPDRRYRWRKDHTTPDSPDFVTGEQWWNGPDELKLDQYRTDA